jgi:hypothetical protein
MAMPNQNPLSLFPIAIDSRSNKLRPEAPIHVIVQMITPGIVAAFCSGYTAACFLPERMGS